MEYGSILEDVVFVIIIIGPIQTQQGQSQKNLGQFNVLLIFQTLELALVTGLYAGYSVCQTRWFVVDTCIRALYIYFPSNLHAYNQHVCYVLK